MNTLGRGLSPVWRIYLFVSLGLLPILSIHLLRGVYSSGLPRQDNVPAKEKPLKINNNTQSLQVVDVQRNGQEARLLLRNNSNKDIAAFKISTASYGIMLDFTPDLFNAGTDFVRSLTIPETEDAVDEVSIVAVLFDDQTGDGNPMVVRQMMERRKGEKLQLLKILPLIDSVLIAPKEQFSERLDAAEKAAIELPDSLNSADSVHFRAGLHDAKERILSDLRTAKILQKDPSGTIQDSQLRYLKDHYARKISKLPK